MICGQYFSKAFRWPMGLKRIYSNNNKLDVIKVNDVSK